MKNEYEYFHKIRRLSLLLIFSGAVNIVMGGLFFYWVFKERPPTPYCELQPAASIHQLPPLTDQRSIADVVVHFRKLSFEQLAAKLHNTQVVEDGYTQRDLALASLKAFHYFDLNRALQSEAQPDQERTIICGKSKNEEQLSLKVYPGLTDRQFDAIIHYAYTERWPVTGQGLFLLMQKEELRRDPSLAEAFYLTPEFAVLETLFSRSDVPVERSDILQLVVDGDWQTLSDFAQHQRASQDLSPTRRQKLLLDYIDKGSKGAAYVLLKTDGAFAAKKLDDKQVLAMLKLLNDKTPEAESFALSLLASPRSYAVCQQAAFRLYEYSGKPIPDPWNYEAALAAFAPQKLLVEKVQKAVAAEAPIKKIPTSPMKPGKGTEVYSTSPTAKPKPVKVAVKSQKEPSKAKPVAQTEPSAPKPKPLPPTAARKDKFYVVQEGDSLWKISRRFNVDVETLRTKNGLKSDALKPGMTIRIQ